MLRAQWENYRIKPQGLTIHTRIPLADAEATIAPNFGEKQKKNKFAAAETPNPQSGDGSQSPRVSHRPDPPAKGRGRTTRASKMGKGKARKPRGRENRTHGDGTCVPAPMYVTRVGRVTTEDGTSACE